MYTKRFLSMFLTVLIVIAISAFPFANPARAASIITVDSISNAAVTDGQCTLYEAILNANNNRQTFPDCDPGSGNDTIDFAYPLTNIPLGRNLPQITDLAGLTIEGYNEISINGNGAYSIFSVAPSAALALNGLTLTGGVGYWGGAIFNEGGTLTVTNSTFSNNSNDLSADHRGGRGGAIYNYSGTATITNSHFSHNSADSGGAIYNGYEVSFWSGYADLPASLTITNSTFSDNTADSGGGAINNVNNIYGDPSGLTITNSIFSNNTAGSFGGAMYGASGPNAMTIRDSTFDHNSALDGGAVFIKDNTLAFTNNTFSDNHALRYGGAIYNDFDGFGTLLTGHGAIQDSLFMNNSAGAGGAVFNDGRLIFIDSTFSGNQANGVLSSNPLMGHGGGVLNNLGAVSILNSTFSSNHSVYGSGGGLYNTFYDSTGELLGSNSLEIMNSTFTGNGAPRNGGGIFTKNSTTISSSAFTNNTSGSGGGIYNDAPTQLTEQASDPVLAVTNSTFYYNTSSALGNNNAHVGGGSLFNAGTTSLINNTFSSDAASPLGADIFQSQEGSTVPTLSLYNNLLAADSAGSSCVLLGGTITGSHNLFQDLNSGNTCGLTNGVNGNLVGFNPNLGALTSSPAYFPLNAGSPAIDIGGDAYCPTTDQRGAVRPQGAHCDIGAYEAQAPTPTNTPIATATAMPTLTSTPTVVATPTNTSTPLPAPTQCSDIDIACLPPPDGS
jgi:predicted outer membrane repeat protein